MLEPFAAHLPIPPPQSLRLAIAELEDHRCISELQVPTPHSPHDFHSLQLTTAHGCPLQQTSSGWRSQSKGTFLNSSEGDIIIKFQHRNIKSPKSARGFWVFLESLWALGAVSIHRSELETAFSEPLEDQVFREADI